MTTDDERREWMYDRRALYEEGEIAMGKCL
jgi:hypothetical protein